MAKVLSFDYPFIVIESNTIKDGIIVCKDYGFLYSFIRQYFNKKQCA